MIAKLLLHGFFCCCFAYSDGDVLKAHHAYSDGDVLKVHHAYGVGDVLHVLGSGSAS